jgi:hypothetical protein
MPIRENVLQMNAEIDQRDGRSFEKRKNGMNDR